MKCVHCGNEIPDDSLFCKACGQEVQIVPDYSHDEDDVLKGFLDDIFGKGSFGKKKNKLKISIVLGMVAVLSIALVAAILIQTNNFAYQYGQGIKYSNQQEYLKAKKHLERSLKLERSATVQQRITVREHLAKSYLALDELDSAIPLFYEVIELDASNRNAVQQLIALYQSRNDIESILKLKEGIQNEELLALFSEWKASPPKFSPQPGTYSDSFDITLKAEEGAEIYFTLDGSDPSRNGRLFKEGISMGEQEQLLIRAVAKSKYGIYSEVVSGAYEMKYDGPALPVVRPDGADSTVPILITIEVPKGAKAYYTWDGSIPTVQSTEYRQPIKAPEGNRILSVIIVQYGLISDVQRCNFRYIPSHLPENGSAIVPAAPTNPAPVVNAEIPANSAPAADTEIPADSVPVADTEQLEEAANSEEAVE